MTRRAVVLIAAAVLVFLLLRRATCTTEYFLGGLVNKIKDAAKDAAQATKKVTGKVVTAVKAKTPGVVQKVKAKAPGVGQTAKVVGIGLLGGPLVAAAVTGGPAPVQAAPAATNTYAARQWDGVEWSCPANTVDSGAADNAQACISSATISRQADGSCPPATVPDDNNACAVGWTTRVQNDSSAWVCPSGTSDTGTTWSTAPGNAGYRQCRVTQPYTLRVAQQGKWVCPPGTLDTGRTWGVVGGENQCKWGAKAA